VREEGRLVSRPIRDAVNRPAVAENDCVMPFTERELLELALRVENRPLDGLARRLVFFTWKATPEQDARGFWKNGDMAAKGGA